MYKKVLAAIDGSDDSMKALNKAIEYVADKKDERTLIVVTARERTAIDILTIDYASDDADLEAKVMGLSQKNSEEILEKAKSTVQRLGINATYEVLVGLPIAEIISDYAKEHQIDLIVLGHRGLGKVREFFLGSVSLRVASIAEVSILIVK